MDILVDALRKYNSFYIAHLCTQSLTILSSPSYLEILSVEFSFPQNIASFIGDIIIPDSAGAMSKQRLKRNYCTAINVPFSSYFLNQSPSSNSSHTIRSSEQKKHHSQIEAAASGQGTQTHVQIIADDH